MHRKLGLMNDGRCQKKDRRILFDDDNVSLRSWEQMSHLCGGVADGQIAYINLYKKVTIMAKIPCRDR